MAAPGADNNHQPRSGKSYCTATASDQPNRTGNDSEGTCAGKAMIAAPSTKGVNTLSRKAHVVHIPVFGLLFPAPRRSLVPGVYSHST